MAVKFSQFTVGATLNDIDYLVGYKSTNNVQIPVSLVGAGVDSFNTRTGAITFLSSDIPDLGVTEAKIADDSVTYAKLAAEFTTSAALATDVDFATAQVFTKTLTGATTLTFSNTEIGMVKDLVITGDFTLTLPAGSTVAGTYDGTVSNLIQIVVTGASQYWYSISQPQ